MSDIERGARNLSLESISKLARALEISVAALFSQLDDSVSAPDLGELVDILFVEDNADDVELTLALLKEAKITNRIHVVRDGAAALDFLFCKGKYTHRQPDNRPQVILLDLGLPKISGLEVLRRIKADARTRTIPVVVLTGSRHDRDALASREFGAKAYIVKPVGFKNLSEITPQLSLHWALVKPRNEVRA